MLIFIKEKVFYFDIDLNENVADMPVTWTSELVMGEVPAEYVEDLVWLPLTMSDYWVNFLLILGIFCQFFNLGN